MTPSKMSQALSQLLKVLGICCGSWLVGNSSLEPLLAQVINDNTLPTPTSITSANQTFRIEQGTQVGQNLFHSFKTFSIPTGFKATFTPNLDVQNLFVRVTGNDASNIDGLIQVDGTSDLFLINPNGIVFGPDAALDLGGSFFATTAEQVNFGDNIVFETSSANINSLLSISTPSGLQFGQAPGEIVNQAGKDNALPNTGGLKVRPNQTIALIGGQVSFSGGRIVSPQSNIFLSSLGAYGSVLLRKNNDSYSVNQAAANTFDNIILSDFSLVDSSGNGNGLIQLQGENISVTGGSRVLAINVGDRIGAGINIEANEKISIIGTAPVDTPFLDSINLSLGTEVPQRSSVRTSISGNGSAGDISIKSNNLSLEAGGRLSSSLRSGSGTGGEIVIQTTNSVVVTGKAPLLGFDPELGIAAERVGQKRDFFAEGFTATIISMTNLSSGENQDLTIKTNDLLVNNGGIITAGPLASGNAGNVRIKATNLVKLSGTSTNEAYPSAISVAALPGPNGIPSGIPGDLFIETPVLLIQKGARIGLDTTSDTGARGEIIASELVEISGSSPSGLFKSRISGQSSVAGVGGTVDLTTADLRVLNGGSIFVAGVSSSAGGDIQVTANSLLLDNDATITTASGALLGGNINLDIDGALLMRRGSRISAGAGAAGAGGNVSINADLIAASSQENNDIIATAEEGAGGNVNITTQGILGFQTSGQLTPNSDISASSEVGLDGNVTIKSPNPELDSTSIELAETFAPPALAAGCYAIQASEGSFVRTGRGGLPVNPVSPVAVDGLWQDLEPLPSASLRSQQIAMFPTSTSSLGQPAVQPRLKEAIAWQFTKDGEVQLVTSEEAVMPNLSNAVTCSGG